MKKILMIMAAVIISASTVFADNWSQFKVGIDPGHGGSDPGALGPAAPSEAELALRVSLALKSDLQALGCGVKLTRESNVDVSLSARVNWSVSYDPWVFNSIHLNAFNGSANGCETWYYWTTGASSSLASKVQATLIDRFRNQASYNVYNRGVKNNAWTVITGSSNVPAILTEGLFVDNYTEWNLINNNSKAGFQAWKNGHLWGWYDYLATINGNITNPRQGGGTQNPTIDVTGSNEFGEVEVGQERSVTINVKGSNLKGNISISSNSGNFVVSPTSLGTGGGNITIKFKPAAVQRYSGTITLSSSGASTKTIAVAGTGIKPKLHLTEMWNYSSQNNNATNPGYDATQIRNICYFNGRLFAVHKHEEILILDAQTGLYLGKLNTEGVNGGTLKLCDVIECEGSIFACNLALQANGETLKVYRWDGIGEDDKPTVVLETQEFGGAVRVGDCISIYNGKKNGEMLFGHDDRTTCRILNYKLNNGTASKTPSVINATTDGSTRLACSTSVRVIKDNTGFWINGKDCALTRLKPDGSRDYYCDTDVKWGNAFSLFNYDGDPYAIINVFNVRTDNDNDNYKAGRMLLLNVKDGYTKPTSLGEYPNNGLGTANRNTNCTGGVCSVAGPDYVMAWVCSTTQGIAGFKAFNIPSNNAKPQGDDPNLYVLGPVNKVANWSESAYKGIPAYKYGNHRYYATIVSDGAEHQSFAFCENRGVWSEAAATRWTSPAEPLKVTDGQIVSITYQPYSGNRYDIPAGTYYVDINTKENTMAISKTPNVFFIAVDDSTEGAAQHYLTNDTTRAVKRCDDGIYRGKVSFPPHTKDGSLSYFSVSTTPTFNAEEWSTHNIDRWGVSVGARETLNNGVAAKFQRIDDNSCYYVAPGTYDVEINVAAATIKLTKSFPKDLWIGGQVYGHTGWSVEKDLVKCYNAGNGKYYATVVSDGKNDQRFGFIDAASNNCHRFTSGVDRDATTWGSVKSIKEEANTKTNGCFSLNAKGTYYVELDLNTNKMTVSDTPNVFFVFYDTVLAGGQKFNTESMAYACTKIGNGLYSATGVKLTKKIDVDLARFSLTTAPGNGPEDWSTIKYDRWGPAAGTHQIHKETEEQFIREPEGVYAIEPDTYRVDINLTKGTIKLTPDKSYVSEIKTDNEGVEAVVIGGRGEISVVSSSNNIDIYSINGHLVSRGKDNVTVAPGVYVVRVDGKTTKVIVK